MDEVTYAIISNGIRWANNIVSEIAGQYSKKLTPQAKEHMHAVLSNLMDFQSECAKATISKKKR